MSRPDARTRAILARRFNPPAGAFPADRRTYAQLTGQSRWHREPGAPTPAELVREAVAADALKRLLGRRTLPWED